MTKEEMGDILEPFYQYVGRQSDDEEWVELRDLVYELVGKLERPKGKWIGDKCSNCGYIDILKPYAWVEQNGEMIQVLAKNFCSNCGADMRGEE